MGGRGLLTGAVTFAAAAVVSVSGAASAQAISGPPPGAAGGGWVATPHKLNSIALTMRVPRLDCKKMDGRLRMGILGDLHSRRAPRPLGVGVVASCHGGRARYVAFYGTKPGDLVPVKADDRIHVILSASGFEIDNRTSGAGVAGYSGSTGAAPTLLPSVLLGARAGGRLNSVAVRFSDAAVNGKALGSVQRHRQAQPTTAIPHQRVTAGPLDMDGHDFVVSVR